MHKLTQILLVNIAKKLTIVGREANKSPRPVTKQYKKCYDICIGNDSQAAMKEQKKNKRQVDKKTPDVVFTVDESLSKYKGPEYTPPKLKEIEKNV